MSRVGLPVPCTPSKDVAVGTESECVCERMEHKTWLWRKKSTEKIAVATDKPNAPSNEIRTLLNETEEMENGLKNLNDELSSVLSECNAKDDLMKKHAKMAQDAMAGWDKAEAKAASMKQELDEAVRQKAAVEVKLTHLDAALKECMQQRALGEERSTHLDAALKECMQQLRFVREEQERRIHDAVMKASKEFEKSEMILQGKLAEMDRRLAKISLENTQLSKAVLAKEMLIEGLSKQKAQAEADFRSLRTRLESMEKDNASLKYEVRVLEKELEIRNEEREVNQRTADASHKQHLESVKKIAKLESECQRLRVLVRKRLPGPAALAKMKSEVEVLERDPSEIRRRRSNSNPVDLMVLSAVDNLPGTSSKNINFPKEPLCAMQEENKALKEALKELQFSRSMFGRTASKLSHVESHLHELSKTQATLEPSRSSLVSHELSLASMSDVGSDEKASCAESWASALISELEYFKHDKQRGSSWRKSIGTSDINLMDDFIEMERLAIVSVDKQSESPCDYSDVTNATVSHLELNGSSLEVTGRDIIPVLEPGSEATNLSGKASGWIKDVLKAILEQANETQRKPDEILEDVRLALANINDGSLTVGNKNDSLKHPDAPNTPHDDGCIPRNSTDKALARDSCTDVDAMLTDKNNHLFQSDLGKSICKVIELIEGIALSHLEYGVPETLSRKDASFSSYKITETPSGYIVRVFQWRTSELSVVLQQFVHTCYDLLNGKANVNRFAQELSSALDWVVNHCFSLQDVSSMREAIKKHFDWDETRSESEAEVGMLGQLSEVDKSSLSCENLSGLPMVPASHGHHNCAGKDKVQSTIKDENKNRRDVLIAVDSAKEDLKGIHQSATDGSELLMNQLQKSAKTMLSLKTELKTLQGSEGMVENQNENHKSKKEDTDTQLTMAKVELEEARQKSSCLEVELENKNVRCEELEAACLDLQLQLESLTKNTIPNHELYQEDKQLRDDREITAASEKLAECQETILNLGKQLKALAAPREAALFDKVISTPAATNATTIATSTATTTDATLTESKNTVMSRRSSLLDRMLAEDNANMKPPSDKNTSSAFISNGTSEPVEKILILDGSRPQDDDDEVNSLAIVPSKKQGGISLWRKLWRKKKATTKKPSLPFAP